MPTHKDVPIEGMNDLPFVPSPYEGTKISGWQHLRISAYWLATNFLWGALLLIMLPGEIREMAPYFRVTALSLLTGISALVALIVPLIVGALSDRCASKWGRRRPYIVAGVAINVVGLAIMWAVFQLGPHLHAIPPANIGLGEVIGQLLTNMTFMGFLMGFMVVQFGNNVASAAYSGVIPDLVPEHQRGAASGYMALMSQLGSLFGAVGCGFLLNGQPEGTKYILLIVALVGIAAITVFGIKETPLPERPPSIHWQSYVKSLWIDPKKYPDFAWVWITRALVMLGFYSILPFISYYLIDVIHIEHPEQDASILMGVILIASSISGVYGGYISDRIGRKKVVYVANVMIAVVSLSFIFCQNIVQVLTAGVVFGLGFGAYTSVDWALGTDVLPTKEHAAKEMAVWHIAMTLPQTIAPIIAGPLISAVKPTIIPAPSPSEWHQFVETFGQTIGPNLSEIFSKTDMPDPVVHYQQVGYALVFVMAAVCFGLGALLLRNVRGVK